MNPFDLFTGESKKQLAAALGKNTAKMDEVIKALTDQGQQNGAQIVGLTKSVDEGIQSIEQGLKGAELTNATRVDTLTKTLADGLQSIERNLQTADLKQAVLATTTKMDGAVQSLINQSQQNNTQVLTLAKSLNDGLHSIEEGLKMAELQKVVVSTTTKMDDAIKVLGDQGQQNGTQFVALTKSLTQGFQSLERGLQGTELQKAVVATTTRLASIDSSLRDASVRPIPVQTFPITDDTRFEKEKQQFALESAKQFATVGKAFIDKLNQAHQPVYESLDKFFSLIDQHVQDKAKNGEALGQAMKELFDCSPKRVIAAFQEHSLGAGATFVKSFNRVIDELARQYPRCRGGIYAARLNYSDVIHFSDEIMATLRTTSTILDDVQRRYDLLEALQGEILSDLDSDESSSIWEATKASFSDGIRGNKDDGFWTKAGKAPGRLLLASTSWAVAVVSSPGAQFQGQLARIHRVKTFVATSILLRQGWCEWSDTNDKIVIPNLNTMFTLKCDFIANRILAITDLVSANGYSLDKLSIQTESITDANRNPINTSNAL